MTGDLLSGPSTRDLCEKSAGNPGPFETALLVMAEGDG